MTLYVCPKCKILIDCLTIFSSHYLCDCGYEGPLYPQREWPKNYLHSLMVIRDYYKEIFFYLKENKFREDVRYYQNKVYETNTRINEICSKYGIINGN